MLHIKEYFEIDPDKKDYQWADRLITYFRMYWSNLVDPVQAKKDMDIILSMYDMENVMKMFKNPKKMGMEFLPIAIMEKIRNILIGERVKAGISVSLDAIDPTAESQRKSDRDLLLHRKEIEGMVSALQQQIGLPPYKMESEEKLTGKSPYKGNVKMFDDLGLDETSGYQVSYFFKVWFKLLHEMRAQDVVNYFMEYNEMKENVDKWCNDIMGKKCIAGQAYVNEMSGAIDNKYIAPERVKLIPGKRADGRDAVCIGYEDSVTVSDVIKRIGNDFDWERDMAALITSVNYSNKREFTGIWDGTTCMYETGVNKNNDTRCQWNDFLNFKVELGYIEWKTFDAAAYKTGVDWHGNLRYIAKPPNTESSQDSKYKKESWYTEVTYRSYFLATSSITQRLIKFGPLYHQTIEGAEDEYSNYSIFFKKEAGPNIAKVAKPWIELAQEAFTKFRWMVRKAKPKGRAYNYESLIKVASKMINEGGAKEKIHGVIKMFEEGINEIFTIPEINGEKVGGGVNPNYDLPNGLDPTALSFKQIVDWCVEAIKNDLGINDIREAYSPKPNDGLRLQMASLEQSRNATNYMSEMIDSVLRQFAKYNLILVQDIVRYKDTIPYNFLKRALGETAIKDIKELDAIAIHRYGIFVNSFATYNERQRVLQETNEAWRAGEISYEAKMLIDSINDHRKAAYIMAFEKTKAKREKEQEAQQLHMNAMQLEKTKHDNKMAEIQLEGDLDIKARQIQGYYYYQAQIAIAQSREDIQKMKQDGKPDEINLKTQAKIEEKRAEQSLNTTRPLV